MPGPDRASRQHDLKANYLTGVSTSVKYDMPTLAVPCPFQIPRPHRVIQLS